MKNQLLDNLLKPQLSQALLEREREFKRIYSATFERCREQTARSHAYRNRFKLGHHLDIGQKVLYENHDDFYERFMERRVQKLNNPEETTSADSIPFPIVPLSSTPNVLPTKRISNTSDDSVSYTHLTLPTKRIV